VTQTVAGYLGTGSHGTGVRTRTLSAQVAGLHLVDGQGEVRRLGPDSEPELFRAAGAHLGCLGVVTEVTLACVDPFDLEERLELIPIDTVLSDLSQLLADNDYLKLWWLPPSDRFLVYRFNRTTEPRTKPGLQGRFDRSGLSGLAFGALAGVSRAVPPLTPLIMGTVQRSSFGAHRRVDRSDLIIPYAGSIPRHQETEYAIAVERAPQALDAVRRMILQTTRFRVNFPLEVRFVAADDVPLSPACGRDVCFIGAYVASRRWAGPYFEAFEELIAEYDGRPHWGKTTSRTAADFRRLYPGYEEFDRIRRNCDPAGVFRNPFVDRVFGLESG
jgi:FAD/FMN-containing dehydrogenase